MPTFFAKSERRERPRRMRRVDIRYLLYFYLHAAGVLATTLLITWGLFVLAFLMIGGFSVDGLMHQLANLSTRYVTAAPDRIASFRQLIFTSHLLLSSAVLFFRWDSLLPSRESRHG